MQKINGSTTIDTLAEGFFDPVNMPGEQEPGLASYIETDMPMPRVLRVGMAWNSPPEVEFTDNGSLPEGFLGTQNINLPPAFGAVMQKLRDGKIDSANPDHVKTFQTYIALCSEMMFPAIISKIAADLNIRKKVSVKLKLRNGTEQTETRDWRDLLSNNPFDMGTEITQVKTISGAISEAEVMANFPYTHVDFDIGSHDRLLKRDITFLAIHRGGVLTSLMGAYISKYFGIDSCIVGIDSKRIHGPDGSVIEAKLKVPDGYANSNFSVTENGFVMPLEKPSSSNIVVVFDPMIATASSSIAAIKDYCNITRTPLQNVYVVGFFAGDYCGLKDLSDLGVNTISLAHDAALLNALKYIGPGLGDAGEKLSGKFPSGEEIKDTSLLLHSMLHLCDDRPYLKRIMNEYHHQICGRPLFKRPKRMTPEDVVYMT